MLLIGKTVLNLGVKDDFFGGKNESDQRKTLKKKLGSVKFRT